MSIHRSKGLEFPVVFLCDCAKPFNRAGPERHDPAAHRSWGSPACAGTPRLQTQFSTVPDAGAAAGDRTLDALGGAAGALCGAHPGQGAAHPDRDARQGWGEARGGWPARRRGTASCPPYQVRGAARYLDWVLMAAVHHPGRGRTAGAVRRRGRRRSGAGRVFGRRPARWGRPARGGGDGGGDAAAARPGAHRGAGAAARLALSLRARDADPHQDGGFADLQGGARQKLPLRGTARLFAGAGAHRRAAWQRRSTSSCSFPTTGGGGKGASPPSSNGWRGRASSSRQEADAIDAGRCCAAFFRSAAGRRRIFRADRVWRELRFLAEVGAGDARRRTPTSSTRGGKTAVQGVADCVFAEGGGADDRRLQDRPGQDAGRAGANATRVQLRALPARCSAARWACRIRE